MVSSAEASFLAIGLSHHTAPVEVREQAALSDDLVRTHLEKLRSEGICEEALIVSTCNRVELYAVGHAGSPSLIKGWLRQFHGPSGDTLDRYLVCREGRDAVVHLFQVASSLDSLVIGEPQILGQVKQAVRLAEESGSLGRWLGALSRASFSVAKRVRTETAVGRFRIGIGNAGVDLARQIFGDLKGKHALLIGVGEMGQQVATALQQDGLARLAIMNRTHERAVELARELRGVAVPLDQLDSELPKADIVITAIGGQTPLISKERVRNALRDRNYLPLFLVDLAVPRNIDPSVGSLEDAYLFNIDDLTQVLERGRESRETAALEGSRIVEEEADRFLLSLREVELGPSIGRITRHAEELRQREIERAGLADLTPEQREHVEAMTRALVKKLLDSPLRSIREAARTGDTEKVATLLSPWEEQ